MLQPSRTRGQGRPWRPLARGAWRRGAEAHVGRPGHEAGGACIVLPTHRDEASGTEGDESRRWGEGRPERSGMGRIRRIPAGSIHSRWRRRTGTTPARSCKGGGDLQRGELVRKREERETGRQQRVDLERRRRGKVRRGGMGSGEAKGRRSRPDRALPDLPGSGTRGSGAWARASGSRAHMGFGGLRSGPRGPVAKLGGAGADVARDEWMREAAVLRWRLPIGPGEVEGVAGHVRRRGTKCPAARGGVLGFHLREFRRGSHIYR